MVRQFLKGLDVVKVGKFLQPAVKPAVIAGGTTGALFAAARPINAFGRARNPPGQMELFDTDASKPGPESGVFHDPVSGKTYVFGSPPAAEGNPDRKNERIAKTGIIAGAAALGGLALVLALRGGK